MTLSRLAAPALLAAIVAWAATPGNAADMAAGPKKDPVQAITSQLICPCSCGEVLSGCTCDVGIALKGYVGDELKGGKDKDAIEAALIAKYGEVILGAPKAKGFNLVVWVAPFLATFLGFGIASMVLVRWVRRTRELAAAAGAPGSPSPDLGTSPDALRARAEAELRELKE